MGINFPAATAGLPRALVRNRHEAGSAHHGLAVAETTGGIGDALESGHRQGWLSDPVLRLLDAGGRGPGKPVTLRGGHVPHAAWASPAR